jgi:hypothetical protein
MALASFSSRAVNKIYQKAANNTGAEEVVEVASRPSMDAFCDGHYLFTVTVGINRIWVLPLFGDRKPFPYVQTEFQENQPRLSLDGRWLAYRSNNSKRDEIYVVSFPRASGRIFSSLISRARYTSPLAACTDRRKDLVGHQTSLCGQRHLVEQVCESPHGGLRLGNAVA